MPNDAPTIRESIEAAMQAAEAPEVEASPEAPEVEPVEAEPAEEAAQSDRTRDEKGRFASKPADVKPEPKVEAAKVPAKVAAPVADKGKPAAAAPAPASPAPAPEAHPVKAPQSFKPAVRELAAKLPAEYRPILEEAVRIDNDAKRALNDSAQARQFASQVQQSLAPYETIARSNGMDAMSFAGNALQAYAAIYQGQPQHAFAVAAQVVGMLSSRFGQQAALDGINAAMGGQAPQVTQQQPQDVSRLVQQEWDKRLEQAQVVKASQDWEAFVATRPEFLDDLKNEMREILELAGRQGRNMTYQQAYDRALKYSEDHQTILAGRKSADAARAQAPTVRQAKAAGSMVKAAPVAAGTRPTGPRTLREDVEAAVAAAGRT